MRDEHYSPFKGSPPSEQPRLEAVTVFMMARVRGDQTDSMRGSLRVGPHGWDAVYLLNGESLSVAVVRGGQRLERPVPFHP